MVSNERFYIQNAFERNTFQKCFNLLSKSISTESVKKNTFTRSYFHTNMWQSDSISNLNFHYCKYLHSRKGHFYSQAVPLLNMNSITHKTHEVIRDCMSQCVILSCTLPSYSHVTCQYAMHIYFIESRTNIPRWPMLQRQQPKDPASDEIDTINITRQTRSCSIHFNKEHIDPLRFVARETHQLKHYLECILFPNWYSRWNWCCSKTHCVMCAFTTATCTSQHQYFHIIQVYI